MTAAVEPAELARLLDTAERPRASNWSLRAALTRYAQPQPQRASDVVELLRRTESALHAHAKTLEKDGHALWAALAAGGGEGNEGVDPFVVGVLQALAELDRVGDVLAEWAVDRAIDRPDEAVDTVVADLRERLERLGVPHEERPRPTGRRGV
ncbi:MAG TPA: hypothetical protein VF230_00815 [Acidimicrobiales bacterium]